jgi:pyruvate carboxylase
MIHPGYGFLSENATFAQKVEDAGLIFIGPRPDVIDALGDKTKARTIGIAIALQTTQLTILAMKCKVPVVPGTPGPVSDPSEAHAFVEEYGFPVIIKVCKPRN